MEKNEETLFEVQLFLNSLFKPMYKWVVVQYAKYVQQAVCLTYKRASIMTKRYCPWAWENMASELRRASAATAKTCVVFDERTHLFFMAPWHRETLLSTRFLLTHTPLKWGPHTSLEIHLSKGRGDFKQKCTQLLVPFSGKVYYALSFSVLALKTR